MVDALDHERAAAYLAGAKRFGIHPSLDGITALAERLGRPQDAFRAIQVAGTNGKTSVARMTAAMLTAHGRRTGVFTSPHLTAYTEQIAIDGVDVSQAAFSDAVEEVREAASALGELTEFELVCATALVVFRAAGVEWGVLEVGMGGRWDATSVVSPRVAIVTGVGIDHAEHLGDTLEAIAGEKACIIGEDSVAVLGPGTAGVREVFLQAADVARAPVIEVGEGPATEDGTTFEVTRRPGAPGDPLELSVHSRGETHARLRVAAPSYQAGNVATAVATAEIALGGPLDGETLRRTMKDMCFPGRFEVVACDPYVVLDGAHNPQAAQSLAGAITEAFGEDLPLVVVGVLDDKDARGIIATLASVASGFIAARSGSDRALSEQIVADVAEEVTGVRPPAFPSVADAIATARGMGLSVVVTGSLTVVGEARGIMGDGRRTPTTEGITG